ncbi:MAG: hypothetical protein U5K54_15105 [Cytophagales bacterium]|nr:hypothetical protein [Cytophagales bacterium]
MLLQIDRWRIAEQLLKDGWSKISKASRFSGLVEAKLGAMYIRIRAYLVRQPIVSPIQYLLLSNIMAEASKEYQLTLANYGALLMEQGKYDRAEEVLAEVIKVMENSNWKTNDLLTANAQITIFH